MQHLQQGKHTQLYLPAGQGTAMHIPETQSLVSTSTYMEVQLLAASEVPI